MTSLTDLPPQRTDCMSGPELSVFSHHSVTVGSSGLVLREQMRPVLGPSGVKWQREEACVGSQPPDMFSNLQLPVMSVLLAPVGWT